MSNVSGKINPPLPETIAMRKLDRDTRDQLIADGANVVDLRPTLEHAKRQRVLAAQYRKGGPKGKGPTRA